MTLSLPNRVTTLRAPSPISTLTPPMLGLHVLGGVEAAKDLALSWKSSFLRSFAGLDLVDGRARLVRLGDEEAALCADTLVLGVGVDRHFGVGR